MANLITNITIFSMKAWYTPKSVHLVNFILLSFFIFQPTFIQAQKNDRFEINYKSHKLKFNSLINKQDIIAKEKKRTNENMMLLDSVYVTENNGNETKNKRVYYSHNSGKISKSTSHQFDEDGDYEHVVETKLYNSDELVEKITLEVPTYVENPIFYWDSTIMTIYKEELEYENAILTVRIKNHISSISNSRTAEYFDYNEQNQIEYYQLKNWAGSFVTIFYYDDKGNKTYEVELDNYKVRKYTYDQINDTLITYKKESQNYFTEPLLDTVETWINIVKYSEVFDTNGRLTYLSQKTVIDKWGSNNDYEAIFEYNSDGQLTFASYSMLVENKKTEILRITNTYNVDNLISTSEREFFNHWDNTWAVEEYKVYYYSTHLVGVAETESLNLSFYPNPTHDFVHFSNSSLNNQSYTVSNLNGQIVSHGKLLNNAINISNLKKGLYFIKIADKQTLYFAKVLKQ